MGGETETELLQILETAIRREREAGDLYGRGAELAIRPEVRDLFLKLSEEEGRHERLLRELYHDIKKRLGMKILRDEEDEA